MSTKLDLDNNYPLYLNWKEMPVWKEFHYFSRILGVNLSENSCKILQEEAEIAYDEQRIWEYLQNFPERIKQFKRGVTYTKIGDGLNKRKRDKICYFRKEYKKEHGIELSINDALPLFEEWYAKREENKKKLKEEKIILKQSRDKKKAAYNKAITILDKIERQGYENLVILNIHTGQVKQFKSIMECSRFVDVSHSHLYKANDGKLVIKKEWVVKIFGR
jgi:hypothetical protein